MQIITFIVFLLLAFPVDADCSCQCLDGAPRTLCTHVDEAADNPDLCGAEPPLCPTVSSSVESQRFTPPAGAENCREAELRDPRSDAPAAIVKVCDPARPQEVDPGASLM